RTGKAGLSYKDITPVYLRRRTPRASSAGDDAWVIWDPHWKSGPQL
ncbi:aliphatic sulfonate ABC transporter substrate-binding protein, partial [Klebsiella pneumoniae]